MKYTCSKCKRLCDTTAGEENQVVHKIIPDNGTTWSELPFVIMCRGCVKIAMLEALDNVDFQPPYD